MRTRMFTLDEIRAAYAEALPHPAQWMLLERALLAAKPEAKTCESCPRWCGWEYPGHVNDPKPGPGDRFVTIVDGPIRRARCTKTSHDFNPAPAASPPMFVLSTQWEHTVSGVCTHEASCQRLAQYHRKSAGYSYACADHAEAAGALVSDRAKAVPRDAGSIESDLGESSRPGFPRCRYCDHVDVFHLPGGLCQFGNAEGGICACEGFTPPSRPVTGEADLLEYVNVQRRTHGYEPLTELPIAPPAPAASPPAWLPLGQHPGGACKGWCGDAVPGYGRTWCHAYCADRG